MLSRGRRASPRGASAGRARVGATASRDLVAGRYVHRDLRAYRLAGPVPASAGTGQRVAAVASNESPYDPLPGVDAAVRGATGRLSRYPDPFSAGLAARIARSIGVAEGQVLVGPGSLAVGQLLVSAIVDPGEEIVVPTPSFEGYGLLAGISGARLVPVPLGENGYDLDRMRATVARWTRMLVVCSPNNPTGAVVTLNALRRLLDAVDRRVVVVVDEAYIEYADDPAVRSAVELLDAYPQLVVLRTFSKAYGLAALRVGYAVAAAGLVDLVRRVQLPFSVGSLGQVAATASLDAEAELAARCAATVRRRTAVEDALRGMGQAVGRSQGNFVWLPLGAAAADVADAFAAEGVIGRPLPPAGLRLTVGDDADVAQLLDAAVRIHERGGFAVGGTER